MTGDRIDDGCGTVRTLLSAWTRDELDETRRQEVRRHLAGCTACRDEAAQADPSVLFLGLGGRPLQPEFWQGFDAALRARLEAEKTAPAGWLAGWAERFRVPRLAYVTIPAAMLLVVAGTLLLSRPGAIRVAPISPPVAGGIASPYERPVAPRAGLSAARPELPRSASAAWPLAGVAADPPVLEEVGSAAARVYRFDGTGDDATPIYFVVDETINF
jgi:anti-sigma factor RsiW